MKKQTTIYFSQCAGSVVELVPASYSVRSFEVLGLGYPGQKQFVCNYDGRPRLRARVESDVYQRNPSEHNSMAAECRHAIVVLLQPWRMPQRTNSNARFFPASQLSQ
jgi:hypothetical protein